MWLATPSMSLRSHLGRDVPPAYRATGARIDVLVDELADAIEGIGVPVTAIDPFGYATSGHPGYPKDLVATGRRTEGATDCHIWPAKSDVTGFRIGGKAGEQFQGFYIYRNDRLLQAGGWSDTANPSPARQLARVVLDDASAIGSFVTMNPEKHGLKFEPIFHDAVSHAVASGRHDVLTIPQDAESIVRRRQQADAPARKPAITPDKGFAPAVRKAHPATSCR